MGAAVSRDHAKLPFGYTHARKDHSFNTSSVSRKRLAPRLLRTSDTTSVTPFPIQDGNVSTSASAAPAASSAVSSIPETDSLSLQQQSHTYHETTSHHNYGYNHNNNQHSHHSSSPSHDSSNTTTTTITTTTNNSSSLNVEDGSTITSLSSVPDSGTGGGSTSTVAASVSVPESDSAAETATRTSVSAATAPSSQRMKTRSSQQQHRTTATTSNEHTGQTASAPGSSLTCATSTYHPQHLINSDLAHATPNINNANNNDQYEHQKRIQTEQDNDMDVVSALGIADRLSQTSYDFFGSNSNNTAASPPRSSSLSSQSVQLRPHPQMLTKQDAATLFISGSRNLQQQGEYETRMSTRSDFRGHPSYSKRALSYELKGSERGLLQLQEEDEDFMDLWDDNALRLEGAGEVDSILDEDVEHLSPIPFSDLPSLTNIGLCSHGLVKLSSNIRLLASATCVQM
ncbi:hypothetical protein BGZ54_005417 [Gamsiella multidivaricata]|nr:hypothetical protein BGZ54_005417 [Gamsiella multidivaricata]